MDEKDYLIRIYINNPILGWVVNEAVSSGLLTLKRSFDGMGRVLAIYDVRTKINGIYALSKLHVPYFPLDNYEDFEIKCPHCGERIDDDMILRDYGENVLKGYNICCDRHDCGIRVANVKCLPILGI